MKRRHLMIAVTGLGLAFAFTSSMGGPADQMPGRSDIDVRPYLAQGFAQSAVQAILLQRMQASCPAKTKRAVMIDRRAPLAWFGCWRERDGKVEIAFEDGDFLALEHDRFVWLPEAGT